MSKNIITIGLELATDSAQREGFRSKASLLAWDIVLFKPLIAQTLPAIDLDTLGHLERSGLLLPGSWTFLGGKGIHDKPEHNSHQARRERGDYPGNRNPEKLPIEEQE